MATSDEAEYKKDFIRGVIVNTAGAVLLTLVACITPRAWLLVVIALAIQLLVFAFHGLPYNSEKYYDLSGSCTHFAIVLTSLMMCPGGASPQQVLYGLFSTVWMVRLGTFMYIRILRDGRDPRFDNIKKVKIRFLGVWVLQACWVVIVQLPVILVASFEDTSPAVAHALNVFVLLVWLSAFLLETVADVQKFEFRQQSDNRHKFITSGLWRYARFPNYCGEIVMWTAAAAGASVIGVFSDNPTMHFAWLSPAFTVFLLLKLSGVPLLTAAGDKKWGSDPAYQHYVQHTNLLIPWKPAPPLAGYQQLY
jgi:steroid 5-alpha reductase family enzyme